MKDDDYSQAISYRRPCVYETAVELIEFSTMIIIR